MKVDIIGAGIGGLTTAIALKQKGIQVRVFEQAKSFKPIGAGIVLAINAMQVFAKLGLKEEITENGVPLTRMKITKADLAPLLDVEFAYFEEKFGETNTAIHRGVLQQILASKLEPSEIFHGHQLQSIRKLREGCEPKAFDLSFGQNRRFESDLVLGADGLNSTVRNALFSENTIRQTNQVCWRGVTEFDLPARLQTELNEAWGKGDRFGFVQIGPRKVYWYALKTFKEHVNEFSIEELPSFFADYHPVVKKIIEATPENQIHTAEISDLEPIKTWHQDQVCLIGDAAHATTPNMGQGACQAIEDAHIIADCLEKYSPEEAFAKFQALRMPKAHQVVKNSWSFGKMAHWSNPIARTFRNTMMKMAPASLNRKQSEQIFQLEQV